MYFIELLVNKFKKKDTHSNSYDPMKEQTQEEDICNHIFMPIDSSGEILACRNCGQIINKKNLKKSIRSSNS